MLALVAGYLAVRVTRAPVARPATARRSWARARINYAAGRRPGYIALAEDAGAGERLITPVPGALETRYSTTSPPRALPSAGRPGPTR